MTLFIDEFETPLTAMTAAVHDGSLCLLEFADSPERIERNLTRRFGTDSTTRMENPAGIRDRLAAYFDGEWKAFDGLPLATGGTPFQRTVWKALCDIPAGRAISYAELAENIGNPPAVRAVARANSQNPISIIVPCHRVIGKDGSLTGYAGGLHRKEWLLRHEGALLV